MSQRKKKNICLTSTKLKLKTNRKPNNEKHKTILFVSLKRSSQFLAKRNYFKIETVLRRKKYVVKRKKIQKYITCCDYSSLKNKKYINLNNSLQIKNLKLFNEEVEGSFYGCTYHCTRLKLRKAQKQKSYSKKSSESSYLNNKSIFRCSYCFFIETSFTAILHHVHNSHKVSGVENFRKTGIDKIRQLLKDIQKKYFEDAVFLSPNENKTSVSSSSKSISSISIETSDLNMPLNSEEFSQVSTDLCKSSLENFVSKTDERCKEENLICKEELNDSSIQKITKDIGKLSINNNSSKCFTFIDEQCESFFCLQCDKEFGSVGDYKIHIMRSSHKKENYLCEECECQFSIDEDLEEHMAVSGHINVCYTCTECDLDFSLKHELKTHKSEQHRKLKKWCPECDCEFPSIDALEVHTKYSGHSGGVFWCPECKREFLTYFALKIHMWQSRHKTEMYWCNKCESQFSTNILLNEHMKKTGHKEVAYWCPPCDTEFSTNRKLEHHLKTSGHRLEMIWCPECKRNFPGYAALENHMWNTGHKAQNYWCIVCEKQFATNKNLKQHCNSTGHKTVLYSCPGCDLEFPSNKDLEEHITSITHEDAVYWCAQCHSPFSSKNALKIHIENAGKHRYYCKICQTGFSSSTLNEHLEQAKHILKVHSCPVCQNQFLSNFALKLHIRDGNHK